MSLTEILVVVVLVLVVMGPEKIPEMMRWIGRGMREIRRATNLFRDTMMAEGDAPLGDELEEGLPGPLDLPEADRPGRDGANREGTSGRGGGDASDGAQNDGAGAGATMRRVELEPAVARTDLPRTPLPATRPSDEIRVRYLSPPHRNLF